MNWREKTVARILLIVARLLADDPVIQKEIQNLSTHISVHTPALQESKERGDG